MSAEKVGKRAGIGFTYLVILVIPLLFSLRDHAIISDWTRTLELNSNVLPSGVSPWNRHGRPQTQATALLEFDKFSRNSSCVYETEVVDEFCKNTTCDEHEFCAEGEDPGPCDEHEWDTEDEDGEEGCKMLWFAAIYDGGDEVACNEKGTGYKNFYSVALNSATVNAGESLQPVLLLGRLELEDDSETTTTTTSTTTTATKTASLSKVGRWAEQKGAWVFNVPRLSFQEIVNRHYPEMPPSHRQGPWLRLEIPRLIKEHGLMDKAPNMCKRRFLYTDTDVMFPNKLKKANLKRLSDTLSNDDAAIMYGRESSKEAEAVNTGIMLIDVEKFGKEIPGMLAYFNETGQHVAFDQGLVNDYFNATDLGRSLLPIHYNWKSYWKLHPSTFEEVKIIHTHGPKPGKGLAEIGSCDISGLPNIPYYFGFFRTGICCDRGKTAAWFMDSYEKLLAPSEDICGSA